MPAPRPADVSVFAIGDRVTRPRWSAGPHNQIDYGSNRHGTVREVYQDAPSGVRTHQTTLYGIEWDEAKGTIERGYMAIGLAHEPLVAPFFQVVEGKKP